MTTEVCLGDLVKVKHGFAFSGEYFRDEPPGDVVVTPGNFKIGGGFNDSKRKYYVGPEADGYVLRPNDLIVTMTDLSKNSDTLGFSALVPRSDGVRYLHNQRIGLVEQISPAIDKRYLYYVMASPGYRAEVLAGATGTTVKHTSPSRIEGYRFNLPALPDQRRIAAVLGSLDEKIAHNINLIATLEAMERALFRSWFVEFDPVRARVAGRDANMAPTIAALFPKSFAQSEVGHVPLGWSVRGLDEIASFLNGLALQKFPPVVGALNLPVIKIPQLRSGSVVGADFAGPGLKSDFVIENGDILFSWSGSLECQIWTGGPGALNQHLFKVRGTKVPDWFAYLAVRHYLPEFRHIAAGKATTMGHIQRHHLHDAKVAVPPKPLLQAADAILGPLIEAAWKRRLQSSTLAAVRDALLPRLVSGELRTVDAERALEKSA